MAIEVISFDIDGTIMDFGYNRAFWNEAITHLYAKRHGLSLADAKRAVKAEYKKIDQNDVRWYQPSFWFGKFDIGDHKTIIHDLRHHIRLYGDTIPSLKLLSKKFKLIVITGNMEIFLDIKMESEDIGKFFTKKYSVIDMFNGVKSSDVFKAVLEEMKIPADSMVHIGDDPQFDYLEPRKLGINAFLIERGENYYAFNKPRYKKKVDPNHIIKDLRELNKKISELGR